MAPLAYLRRIMIETSYLERRRSGTRHVFIVAAEKVRRGRARTYASVRPCSGTGVKMNKIGSTNDLTSSTTCTHVWRGWTEGNYYAENV